jgi:hypothetical protein
MSLHKPSEIVSFFKKIKIIVPQKKLAQSVHWQDVLEKPTCSVQGPENFSEVADNRFFLLLREIMML